MITLARGLPTWGRASSCSSVAVLTLTLVPGASVVAVVFGAALAGADLAGVDVAAADGAAAAGAVAAGVVAAAGAVSVDVAFACFDDFFLAGGVVVSVAGAVLEDVADGDVVAADGVVAVDCANAPPVASANANTAAVSVFFSITGDPCISCQEPTASEVHFLTKLVFAAPASFLSTAAPVHVAAASDWHFFKKLVFAAPASFLSDTCDVQVDPSAQALTAVRHRIAASNIDFMNYVSLSLANRQDLGLFMPAWSADAKPAL
jgi:hypothetical protein